MECKQKTYKVVNIISSIILIIAYGFIMVQSIFNIIYSENKKKSIIAERYAYEQFSHEVYSNINSKIISDIEEKEINETCSDDDYYVMNFPIKLESFYDCEGEFNNEINKDMCQNTITKDSLCCRDVCCYTKVSEKKESNYCRDRKINEIDPRDKYCAKFSKYNGKFYTYKKESKEYKICVKKNNSYTYRELLKKYEEGIKNNNNNCKSGKKIFFDSKNHIFCNDDNIIKIKNDHAIVKNIFSVERPNYFNMESNIKLTMMENKIKYNEDKVKKRKNIISKIGSKIIFNTFMESKICHKECYDKNYKNFNKFINSTNGQLKHFLSDESIFSNFKSNSYMMNNKINWYTRDYIGFNNTTELNKFEKYFDNNNNKNNSLYKISKTLYPNYGSFIVGAIIFVLTIIYIIVLIKNFEKEEIDIELKNINMNNLRFLLIFILFWVYLIIYLVEYYYGCEAIYIDMEEFYKNVLEKYNYRRRQLFLVIGIIIFSFNILIELLIQNFRCGMNYFEIGMNGRQVNSVDVNIKIQGNDCNRSHICKLYVKKTFGVHIPNIKKLLSRCNICKEYDIEKFIFNGNEIQHDDIIRNIGIGNNATITIE